MKKLLVCMALILSLSLSGFPAFASATQFSDVPPSHWAHMYVTDMADAGVMNGIGNGQFAPDSKVSAAMFLTLVGRVAFPEIKVTGGDWSGPYVEAAQRAGWLTGTGLDVNDTSADITRYDMAVILAGVADKLDLPFSNVDTAAITDYPAIPAHYKPSVAAVYNLGLITGDATGNFCGTDTMTRAQAATVIWRLMSTPSVTLYAPDGRTILVPAREVDTYRQVGWFSDESEAKTILYAPDGRTAQVWSSEVSTYLSAGWYLEPMVCLYAADGRTTVVETAQKDNYLKVGWFSTPEEARASAQQQLASKSSPSNSSSTRTSNSNHSGDMPDGSQVVYITKTGKRYHYDSTCNGGKYYKVSLSTARSRGLTPCQKCVLH